MIFLLNYYKYIATFVAGCVVSAILTYQFTPTQKSVHKESTIDTKTAANVETNVATNVETEIKRIDEAQYKIIVKKPKFDKEGHITEGSKAVIYEKPKTTVDSKQVIANNTEINTEVKNDTSASDTEHTVTQRALSRFSIGVQTPVVRFFGLTPKLHELHIEGGMRIFSTPFWGTVAFDMANKQIGAGLRVEF